MATIVATTTVAMSGCVPQEASRESHSTSDTFRPDSLLEKPILYLCPKEETDVSAHVSEPEAITTSYPEYGTGWHVTASPDGTLEDQATGRSLYALYYEAKAESAEQVTDEGFVVGRDDLIPFLEEKLGLLGLTAREAEEMIVYWLPRMQEHDTCYVRFSLTDEEQRQNALQIAPALDYLIRIRMVWQGLNAGEAEDVASRIRRQEIEPVDRAALNGFVAVEWGGTEIGTKQANSE